MQQETCLGFEVTALDQGSRGSTVCASVHRLVCPLADKPSWVTQCNSLQHTVMTHKPSMQQAWRHNIKLEGQKRVSKQDALNERLCPIRRHKRLKYMQAARSSS